MPLRVIFAFYLSNWTIQYLAPFVKLKPPLFDNIIDLDGYLIRVEHEKVVFDEQWWSVPFFLFSQKSPKTTKNHPEQIQAIKP